MSKVKYKCLCCGWTKELPAEWADVRPRFCPNSKCEMSAAKTKGKKSFRSHPDKLEVTFSEEPVQAPVAPIVAAAAPEPQKKPTRTPKKEELHDQRFEEPNGQPD
jgi:hypothetical protein